MGSKSSITSVKKAGGKVVEFQCILECGDDWHKKFVTLVFKARTMRFWNCMAYIPSISGRNMTVVDVNVRASEANVDDDVINQMVGIAVSRINDQMVDAVRCMGGISSLEVEDGE